MDKDARDYIAKYLHDMHSLISHGHEAIRRQRDQLPSTGHAEAQRAVAAWEETLDRHMAALKTRLEGMGESPTSPVQDAASAVAGVVAGFYNKVRSDEASKSVRDDYTFFSHSAIAYLMLHTTCLSLGDHETAAVAERGYRDMASMIQHVNRIMPGLVFEEIKETGMPARDVSAECHRLVEEAWRTSATQTGTH